VDETLPLLMKTFSLEKMKALISSIIAVIIG